MIDAKVAKASCRRKVHFRKVRYARVYRTRREIILEGIDRLPAAFGNNLDTPIREIANRTIDIVPGGSPHGEVPVAYALHVSVDDESSCNQVHLKRTREGATEAAPCREVSHTLGGVGYCPGGRAGA